jgi:hypothetical protein
LCWRCGMTETADSSTDWGGNSMNRKGRDMDKHTPGKWVVSHDRIRTIGPDSVPVATITERWYSAIGPDEATANAALIAAAPDLLECCEEMVNVMEGFSRVVLRDKYVPSGAETRARAAIARARGEK